MSLELGGNDPAIVLADAPIDRTADALFESAFANTGQICFAVKRVYAHRAIHDDLVRALADRADKSRLGNGLDPDTTLGPISNIDQFERVTALVDAAKRDGAVIHSGGSPHAGPGYFYPPTLLSRVEPGMAAFDEEQFGPVLPVAPFDDVEDALTLANQTRFGLGGSVWTADTDVGASLAQRLDVGLAWVNQHSKPFMGAPSGGHDWSGLGRRGGKSGYDHFVSLQVVDVVPVA